jgi:hypothetical protein
MSADPSCDQHVPDARFDQDFLLERTVGADDGIRTRDPNLGKVVLYQLSYVRVGPKP